MILITYFYDLIIYNFRSEEIVKMKKILTLLAILLLLCGCTSAVKQEEKVEETAPETVDLSALTMVSPKGAPVLAFYDEIGNENYSRVGADAINALWTGDHSPDILTVDLSSGIKAIGNGAAYKLAAIVTFGNFYLGSTGSDEDEEMGADDKIVLFGGENALPNKIWHYLYGTEFDENLIYVADAQAAAGALASGKDGEGNPVDYVFLAQPALTGALKQNEKAKVYKDIQAEYTAKSGLNMIQAAVFVNDRVDETVGNAFLDKMEKAINDAVENPELAKEGLSVYSGDEASAQYGFNPDLVVNVLKQKAASGRNAMGLGFARAYEIKNDIDAFMEVLGANKTGEEIYFK